MRIDLPQCDFKNCRRCFDGNCNSKMAFRDCQYQQLKECKESPLEAEWIVPDKNYPDTCSNCMFEFAFDGDDNYVPKYCPECGRKMIRRRTYNDN